MGDSHRGGRPSPRLVDPVKTLPSAPHCLVARGSCGLIKQLIGPTRGG